MALEKQSGHASEVRLNRLLEFNPSSVDGVRADYCALIAATWNCARLACKLLRLIEQLVRFRARSPNEDLSYLAVAYGLVAEEVFELRSFHTRAVEVRKKSIDVTPAEGDTTERFNALSLERLAVHAYEKLALENKPREVFSEFWRPFSGFPFDALSWRAFCLSLIQDTVHGFFSWANCGDDAPSSTLSKKARAQLETEIREWQQQPESEDCCAIGPLMAHPRGWLEASRFLWAEMNMALQLIEENAGREQVTAGNSLEEKSNTSSEDLERWITPAEAATDLDCTRDAARMRLDRWRAVNLHENGKGWRENPDRENNPRASKYEYRRWVLKCL